MKIKTVHKVLFSPAGSTALIAGTIADVIAGELQAEICVHDYTLPGNREEKMVFEKDSLVIWASPVYAGRLPNKLLDYVKSSFSGAGVPAIPVVVYGNRSYDEALAELTGILREGGMLPFAAAAVPTRHVFSEILGAGRPDQEDLDELKAFAGKAAEMLKSAEADSLKLVQVPGPYPPLAYYTPLKEDGQPAKFLKALPVVDQDRCSLCGLCISLCPMDSIKMEPGKLPVISGICIKCQACILRCPSAAIEIRDESFRSHRKMLEKTFLKRKKASFLL